MYILNYFIDDSDYEDERYYKQRVTYLTCNISKVTFRSKSRISYIDRINTEIGSYFTDWKTLYKRLEIVDICSSYFESLVRKEKKKYAKGIKGLISKYMMYIE